MVNKDCKCKSCKCGKESFDEMIQQIDDYTKPFTETIISDNEVIREFETGHPAHLYKWHSDPEDRLIVVLEESDWRFQYDNELPTPLMVGIDIKIPTGVIHRIIPGTTDLKIKIYKL
jgi:hypothetical protein|tara:strand:- start:158 stop:508 length:351 start_codon:yes stop_codon:yes gene_type:complete